LINASIIVPTLNRSDSLRLALHSFTCQIYPEKQFELLVVDNGSTDDTLGVVETARSEFPSHNIGYFREPVPGLLSGRHRGAQEAAGEILVFVDDDIEADDVWLSAILETFKDPSVHLVGGPSIPRFETSPPRWIEKFFHYRQGRLICTELSLLDIGDTEIRIDPTYVWGLNFSIRKQTFFDLGGFHPDCIPKKLQCFQGDGETGLSLKIKGKGLKAVYVPEAVVYHYIPKERLTVKYFEERFFYQGVCDSFTQIRKNGGLNYIAYPKYYTNENEGNYQSTYEQYKRIIHNKVQKAYVDGFRFHQEAVRNSAVLLNWVLRENFFDYHLPDLKGYKEKSRAIYSE
jgi:glycosyltransferase involved in cell wall biosynthesis